MVRHALLPTARQSARIAPRPRLEGAAHDARASSGRPSCPPRHDGAIGIETKLEGGERELQRLLLLAAAASRRFLRWNDKFSQCLEELGLVTDVVELDGIGFDSGQL